MQHKTGRIMRLKIFCDVSTLDLTYMKEKLRGRRTTKLIDTAEKKRVATPPAERNLVRVRAASDFAACVSQNSPDLTFPSQGPLLPIYPGPR